MILSNYTAVTANFYEHFLGVFNVYLNCNQISNFMGSLLSDNLNS